MVPKKEYNLINGPAQPDESWWAAVLEDAETLSGQGALTADNPTHEVDFVDSSIHGSPGGSSQDKIGDDGINWDRVKELYEGDEVIHLTVASHNRGGLLVEGDEIQGFVPASHIVNLFNRSSNEGRDKALAYYVGRSLQLKVIECDQEQGRIVFSERAAQAEPGKRLLLLETLIEGGKIKGRVTTITDFGVFIDLGGVEGLIHISELSWGRVCHPDKVVSLGEEIEVYILSIDKARSRVSLSLKRLHRNTWESAHDRYYPGKIVKATITNIVSFGAFARLEDGLDGLIHISEFCNQLENDGIESIIVEGQEVEVCILHIDSAQQRLGLSLYSTG